MRSNGRLKVINLRGRYSKIATPNAINDYLASTHIIVDHKNFAKNPSKQMNPLIVA